MTIRSLLFTGLLITLPPLAHATSCSETDMAYQRQVARTSYERYRKPGYDDRAKVIGYTATCENGTAQAVLLLDIPQETHDPARPQ